MTFEVHYKNASGFPTELLSHRLFMLAFILSHLHSRTRRLGMTGTFERCEWSRSTRLQDAKKVRGCCRNREKNLNCYKQEYSNFFRLLYAVFDSNSLLLRFQRTSSTVLKGIHC